ncbi:galactokinase [Nasonia vitripennis]|uniref:Galactokinase n=1 Tax=Nasonia vitripennis TaxID=7425 RepID=A0A7M7G1E9_NASVI|nr:galactokinase [Nasonia vitripennis]XP_008205617.1 galactokinase [Nasonia vitripennis]XP_032454901.1 galactokinase [Nasonia vitripennis]
MATIYPEVSEVKEKALQSFSKEFGVNADICVCAPGRVNLIGEHTDYNEGFVLPMALPMVTMIVGKKNNSITCKIFSLSTSIGGQSVAEFNCVDREAIKPGEPKWANYVKGCIANFPHCTPGFNAAVTSTVPVGSGLSSSAALEVATYTFLEAMTGQVSSKPEDKALACQRAEHEFAGVPCGIMDQFISAMGQEGNALLLDCRDLTTKQIPMQKLDDCVFLITNSNAPHKLSSSAYCERRDCCIEASKLLGKKSLREANVNDLEVLKSKGADEVTIKRVRHVITEIERTLEAAASLEENDFVRFGQLMNESHNSLRDDYEVSSKELDSLVTIARGVDGVLGSRLTGAGFGGCTVTLLKKNVVDTVIKLIKEEYAGTPSFYIAKPSKGAQVLKL